VIRDCGQILAGQTSLDHKFASVERRMRDVEESAARAVAEVRMVSVHLIGDSDRAAEPSTAPARHRIEPESVEETRGGGARPANGRATRERPAEGWRG